MSFNELLIFSLDTYRQSPMNAITPAIIVYLLYIICLRYASITSSSSHSNPYCWCSLYSFIGSYPSNSFNGFQTGIVILMQSITNSWLSFTCRVLIILSSRYNNSFFVIYHNPPICNASVSPIASWCFQQLIMHWLD